MLRQAGLDFPPHRTFSVVEEPWHTPCPLVASFDPGGDPGSGRLGAQLATGLEQTGVELRADPVEQAPSGAHVRTRLGSALRVQKPVTVDLHAPCQVEAVFECLPRPVPSGHDQPESPSTSASFLTKCQQGHLGVEEPEGAGSSSSDRQVRHARGVGQADLRIARIQEQRDSDPALVRPLRLRQAREALRRIIQEGGIGREATDPTELPAKPIRRVEALRKGRWLPAVAGSHALALGRSASSQACNCPRMSRLSKNKLPTR